MIYLYIYSGIGLLTFIHALRTARRTWKSTDDAVVMGGAVLFSALAWPIYWYVILSGFIGGLIEPPNK